MYTVDHIYVTMLSEMLLQVKLLFGTNLSLHIISINNTCSNFQNVNVLLLRNSWFTFSKLEQTY